MPMVANRPKIKPNIGEFFVDGDNHIYQYDPKEAKITPESLSLLKTLKETDSIEICIKSGLIKIISNDYSIVADIAHTINGNGYDPKNSQFSMLKGIY